MGLRPETLFEGGLLRHKRGRSPTLSPKLTAGQSRRRTSDGQAEVKITFEAKQKRSRITRKHERLEDRFLPL